eukprot:gene9985-13435_t
MDAGKKLELKAAMQGYTKELAYNAQFSPRMRQIRDQQTIWDMRRYLTSNPSKSKINLKDKIARAIEDNYDQDMNTSDLFAFTDAVSSFLDDLIDGRVDLSGDDKNWKVTTCLSSNLAALFDHNVSKTIIKSDWIPPKQHGLNNAQTKALLNKLILNLPQLAKVSTNQN